MTTDAPSARSALSLPPPVLDALSFPGIDAARFDAVNKAFGPLPIEGQIDLVNRLIHARGQYVAHRMEVCDGESTPGVRRKRLSEIGLVARRLLRLLHRDSAQPQPWNLHPAITLTLPRLCHLAAERGPDQIWDQGLNRLEAMLTDLAKVADQAEAVFPAEFPNKHGGKRRDGANPATGLVEQLIEIYENFRTRYPESGPAAVCGAPLIHFVRAGLAFAVSAPPESIDSSGRRRQLTEVRFLESDLPKKTRLTDQAIRGIFDRLHRSTQKQS
jgi:hypothetical protein